MKGSDETDERDKANASLAQERNMSIECSGNGRSLQEAIDEVQREFNVRERCFPKWVTEGRIAKSDATDRLERLAAALYFLSALSYGDVESCVGKMPA